MLNALDRPKVATTGDRVATRDEGPWDDGGGRRGPHRIGPRAGAAPAKPKAAGTEEADVDIVRRMRTGSASAFEAFVERFHPVLLDYGRRAGVPRGKREELACDVLTRVALDLLTSGRPTPRNPRVYLIVAFRNRLFHYNRDHARRDRHITTLMRDAALDFEYADEREVAAGLSDHAVRESRSPDWECTPVPPALERLAVHLDEALSLDERWLLIAVGENIPQRQVAEWLGLSYAAARKKLERLRARLNDVAMRYTNTLPPDDAREVQRFFRRCRARIGARERLADADEAGGLGGECNDECEKRSAPDRSDTTGNGP